LDFELRPDPFPFPREPTLASTPHAGASLQSNRENEAAKVMQNVRPVCAEDAGNELGENSGRRPANFRSPAPVQARGRAVEFRRNLIDFASAFAIRR
jgi:hypothetical protein